MYVCCMRPLTLPIVWRCCFHRQKRIRMQRTWKEIVRKEHTFNKLGIWKQICELERRYVYLYKAKIKHIRQSIRQSTRIECVNISNGICKVDYPTKMLYSTIRFYFRMGFLTGGKSILAVYIHPHAIVAFQIIQMVFKTIGNEVDI